MNMNKIMSIVAIVLFLLISLVSCDEAKVSDTTIYQDDKTMMTEIQDSISNKINKQDTVLKACSEKIGNLVVSQNESNDKIEEIQKISQQKFDELHNVTNQKIDQFQKLNEQKINQIQQID